MPGYPKVIEIFDRKAVRNNRNRAAANFGAHDFLMTWTAAQLQDRLNDIKREFSHVLQIGGRSGALYPDGDNIVTIDLAETFLGDKGIRVQADEEFLPFAPSSFDLAISALSLHSVNDLPGTLIQINRALKPDGLCLAALLGGETLWQLRKVIMEVEIKHKGGAGPHIAPFADKQQIGALMQRAGYALPVVDSEIVTVTYDHVRALIEDIRGMGEGNSLKERGAPLNKAMLDDIDTLYKEQHGEEDGRIPASFEIIFLIGWAPHESQQQPLKPGSAEHRLADALQTTEIGSGIKTGD